MEAVQENVELDAEAKAKLAAKADEKAETSEKADTAQSGDSHSCCGSCSD